MHIPLTTTQSIIDKALEALGITNFLLGIHDATFPSLPQEEIGRGSPYTDGAAIFLQFARALGFNGVQLGPQGITTAANPSPYDGTFFSRNPLSLAPLHLLRHDCSLLSQETLSHLTCRHSPDVSRVHEPSARKALQQITAEACMSYREKCKYDHNGPYRILREAFTEFRRQNVAWLKRDALYEVLSKYYGGRAWKQWGKEEEARLDKHLFTSQVKQKNQAAKRSADLYLRHAAAIEDYSFVQFLLAEQHQELRERCRNLGFKLFGDCQIGFSDRDSWYAQDFLLADYVLGAPPSRTNPEGQPWNYPVLDPNHYYEKDSKGNQSPGPGLHFLKERAEKLFDEFDGLRLDHPHGLVCPWVYRSDQHDPVKAVQNGARLFASPDLADHPELAQYSIVRPEQLNYQVPRYDDGWVSSLDPEQVRRYARLFGVFMATALDKCSGACEIACEILSTQPYPIKRVMDSHGLGRFRVTQKADLNNEEDVYRSENAKPEDWLMLGNHDTPSIWRIVDNWFVTGASRQQAEYLSRRLRIPAAERTAWLEQAASDAGILVQAKFADLFIGPARNIMVFFTDLLGNRETYNQPGTVASDNWTLRIPPDYQKFYTERLAAGQALNVPKALAMAIRAKGTGFYAEHRELIQELEKVS